jgi:glycosyltransferase involved in cell wall biosynthesis
MKNKPFILQICPCYVDLDRETGGVANIVRQICLHLAKQGKHVSLLCGNRELGEAKAQPGLRRINEFLSVEIFDQNSHPLRGPTATLTKRFLSIQQDCVAHVHTCFSAFAETAMRACHVKGIPFVFTPHGKLSRHSLATNYWAKQIWWTLTTRKVIRHAAAIAVSSFEEASQMEALHFTQPRYVIPNGYEAPSLDDLGTYARIIHEPYILFLGYLDPRKQPEFLVQAFAKSAACRTHRLVFAGPDTYGHQDLVRRTAQELAVLDRVVFYGAAYGQQKWNLLYNASCLCLPSLGEGLPLVLCEALGAGIPSIFSRECNFQELATHGASVMLREFNPSLWAEAIDRVCLDQISRQAMTLAAKSLQSQYSWAGIVERWCTLYEGLMDMRKSSFRTSGQAHG